MQYSSQFTKQDKALSGDKTSLINFLPPRYAERPAKLNPKEDGVGAKLPPLPYFAYLNQISL